MCWRFFGGASAYCLTANGKQFWLCKKSCSVYKFVNLLHQLKKLLTQLRYYSYKYYHKVRFAFLRAQPVVCSVSIHCNVDLLEPFCKKISFYEVNQLNLRLQKDFYGSKTPNPSRSAFPAFMYSAPCSGAKQTALYKHPSFLEPSAAKKPKNNCISALSTIESLQIFG